MPIIQIDITRELIDNHAVTMPRTSSCPVYQVACSKIPNVLWVGPDHIAVSADNYPFFQFIPLPLEAKRFIQEIDCLYIYASQPNLLQKLIEKINPISFSVFVPKNIMG